MTTNPDPDDTTTPEPPVDEGSPPRETPPGPAPDRRRLTRSRTDDWFGGVAGGLAEYLDVDPTLVRIGFVAAALLSSGLAVIAYIVAWIVIPEAAQDQEPSRAGRANGNAGALLAGGILIIGGALVLLSQLDLDIDLPSWKVGLSAGLILIGLLMVFEARRGFHGGLMTLAILLTVALGVSSASGFDFAVDGAFGESRHTVVRAEDLESEYSHAFGSLRLDLRGVALEPGTTSVKVNVAFGDATIDLPEGVPYRIEADSFFGSIDAEDFDADGVATSRTFTSPGYEDADPRLDIHISTAFGSGRIR